MYPCERYLGTLEKSHVRNKSHSGDRSIANDYAADEALTDLHRIPRPPQVHAPPRMGQRKKTSGMRGFIV